MFEHRHIKLPWPPVLALFPGIAAIIIVAGWNNINMRGGWFRDDKLRMMQLRDFLAVPAGFGSHAATAKVAAILISFVAVYATRKWGVFK